MYKSTSLFLVFERMNKCNNVIVVRSFVCVYISMVVKIIVQFSQFFDLVLLEKFVDEKKLSDANLVCS